MKFKNEFNNVNKIFSKNSIDLILLNISNNLDIPEDSEVSFDGRNIIISNMNNIIFEGKITLDLDTKEPKIEVRNIDNLDINNILLTLKKDAYEKTDIFYKNHRSDLHSSLVIDFYKDRCILNFYLFLNRTVKHIKFSISDVFIGSSLYLELYCNEIIHHKLLRNVNSVDELLSNFDSFVSLQEMIDVK